MLPSVPHIPTPIILPQSLADFAPAQRIYFCRNLPRRVGREARSMSRQICIRPSVAVGPAFGGVNWTRWAEVLIRGNRFCSLVWRNALVRNFFPASRLSSWGNYMILSLWCWLGSAADCRAFYLPPTLLYCRTRLGVWPDLYIVKIAIGNSALVQAGPFQLTGQQHAWPSRIP